MYIDKLNDIVNKYDNTHHSTIKMKSVDVKSNTYVNSSKEINNKDPKFRIGDIIRISKHKNIFAKGYVPNWSENLLQKLKIVSRRDMLLVVLTEKKLLERFTKTNCKNKSNRI